MARKSLSGAMQSSSLSPFRRFYAEISYIHAMLQLPLPQIHPLIDSFIVGAADDDSSNIESSSYADCPWVFHSPFPATAVADTPARQSDRREPISLASVVLAQYFPSYLLLFAKNIL